MLRLATTPGMQPLQAIQPHYRVQPHDGRFAVAYPVPGSLSGELASLCDFRTEHAARMHAAWLNAGLPSFTPRRDPAITELLAAMPVARTTRRAQSCSGAAQP